MTVRGSGEAGACRDCLRHSWLLGELGAVLDRNCRADGRLFELLALEDEELIAALGGRRREELARGYARLGERELRRSCRTAAICRDDERFPDGLRSAGGPRLLHVSGGLRRLGELTREPMLALLGTSHASPYGIEAARSLARELAASGVGLVTERRAGIGLAAQLGILEAGGVGVSISGNGLAVAAAKDRLPAYERLAARGSVAVSELADAARGRRWGVAAGVRIAAGLGAATVLVQAEERPSELRGAVLARSLGRRVGALPGPVDSPASAGCHALLREGARLVRGAADALDLLYGVEEAGLANRIASEALPRLKPEQRELLARVAEGTDTLGGLTAVASDRSALLRDLGELEVRGLLGRTDGGRYVACRTQDGLRYGGGTQMES